VAKSTKAKGEFLRCAGCKGEFLPENVPAAEAPAGK
jgi:hypothetical protein